MKTEKKQYALRPDSQAFDEIRIVTIPRFKESEMSGDEWRISTNVQFYRNGQVVYEAGGLRDIETTTGFLYSIFHKAIDDGHAYFAGDGIHCDQEGCNERAVYLFRIKQDYCVGGGNCGQKKESYTGYHRCFCEKHHNRGDSDLQDNNENYELITVL